MNTWITMNNKKWINEREKEKEKERERERERERENNQRSDFINVWLVFRSFLYFVFNN